MARVLLLVSTTSYRTDAFVEAVRRAGAEGVIGSDRCHQLDQRYQFPADMLQLDFRHPTRAADAIVEAARVRGFDAIVPTSDLTAEIAARACAELGLPHNPPGAAYVARNKHRMRHALEEGGVPCPIHTLFHVEHDPHAAAVEASRVIRFPCVLKPLLLSASRGVIRADDEPSFASAFQRVSALLTTPEMKAAAEEDADGAAILVEAFVPGVEVAVEAILARGQLHPLAVFDKPDPLDGPFFEETLYVTPSRLPPPKQAAIIDATARAATAMGLTLGPVHAELRIGESGVSVIEVAARTIGGLCARTLRFSLGESDETLEDLVVGHALGRSELPPLRPGGASGVMMIPIPRAGVLQAIGGEDEARQVPLIADVTITTRVGEKLVPLPEGASYLGFLFARGEAPAAVEAALRDAHRKLHFTIAPLLS